MDTTRFSRRSSLARLGGLVVAAAGGRAFVASEAEGGNKAVETGAVACVLTPELTEGPYYIAGEKLRRDIRDGHPGALLTLNLRILNAASCKAIKGATVEIWHADAAGNYSGFGAGASNRTFLRGVQLTDAQGLVVFKTNYPGWYQGRSVHIHVKVHVGGKVVHTGQLFFPDAQTAAVYKAAPYSSRPGPDMLNGADSIFVNGGKRSIATVKRSGAGYVGSITMGVHK